VKRRQKEVAERRWKGGKIGWRWKERRSVLEGRRKSVRGMDGEGGRRERVRRWWWREEGVRRGGWEERGEESS